jgi:hypothetical protein
VAIDEFAEGILAPRSTYSRNNWKSLSMSLSVYGRGPVKSKQGKKRADFKRLVPLQIAKPMKAKTISLLSVPVASLDAAGCAPRRTRAVRQTRGAKFTPLFPKTVCLPAGALARGMMSPSRPQQHGLAGKRRRAPH